MHLKRFKLAVLVLIFCFAVSAYAENLEIGEPFANALANSKAVLKSGNGDVSANVSATSSDVAVLTVNASEVTLIDLSEVDLRNVGQIDLVSFDKFFTGLTSLKMKLTGTSLEDAVSFSSSKKLKELILTDSTGLKILDITNLTELVSLDVSNSGLRALNLGTVTVSGSSSMFGGGGSNNDGEVSKPLAALTYLNLSGNVNLDRVGYLVSSDSSSSSSGFSGGVLVLL